MTIGVGGSTIEIELNNLSDMTKSVPAISEAEFKARINKAQQLMSEQNISALYLDEIGRAHV